MSSRNFVMLLVGIAIAAFLVLKPRPYSIGDKVEFRKSIVPVFS